MDVPLAPALAVLEQVPLVDLIGFDGARCSLAVRGLLLADPANYGVGELLAVPARLGRLLLDLLLTSLQA